MSQEVLVGIVAGIPLGRIATPAEISNLFVFLTSDLPSFETAFTIDVNGDMYLRVGTLLPAVCG